MLIHKNDLFLRIIWNVLDTIRLILFMVLTRQKGYLLRIDFCAMLVKINLFHPRKRVVHRSQLNSQSKPSNNEANKNFHRQL